MLAAEETPAEPATGVSLPGSGAGGAGGDGDTAGAVDGGDGDGESGGEGESGEAEMAPREMSRSVQDFLTLTAPLDSLEFGSERSGSEPEQEAGVLVTQEGGAPAQESDALLQDRLKGQERATDWQEGTKEQSTAPVSIVPSRPPVEGAPHESGAAVGTTSPPPPPPPPPSAQPSSPPVAAACLSGSRDVPGGGTGDAADGGEAVGAGGSGGVSDVSDVVSARSVVEDPGGGGGTDTGPHTPHVVPELCFTEATPPRPPPAGEDGLQTSTAEEPPASEPRAFRFVLNEKSEGGSGIVIQTETSLDRSVEPGIGVEESVEPEASTTAVSEYFTAADSTLACAEDITVDEKLPNDSIVDTSGAGDSGETITIKRQLTSTPRGRQSPSFNEFIESSYQTATESLPGSANVTLMGSRHSAPAYAPVAGDDLSVGSEAGCDAALLDGERRDDAMDLAMSDIRQEVKGVVEVPGGAGDVPRVVETTTKEPTLPGESPLPSSPAPLESSETAEPGSSPPRSPSLSSTFGHSTCDELAELPDEEEIRSLCSRAELAPSKLWGSAEDPVGSPSRPDRRLSADVITVIEAAPGRESAATGSEVMLAEEGVSSADTTTVLAEGLMMGENLQSADVTPVRDEDLLMLGEKSHEDGMGQKTTDTTPVMVEGLIVGEGFEEIQETPESADVTPVLDENLLTLGGEIPAGSKSPKASDTTPALFDELVEGRSQESQKSPESGDEVQALDEARVESDKPSVASKQLGAFVEATVPSDQVLADFEDTGLAEKSSSLVDACSNDSLVQNTKTAPEISCPTEESVAMEDDVVPNIANGLVSSLEDSKSSKDAASPEQEASKPIDDVLAEFSTPETEASTELLRGLTAMSSSSEASTLPSQQTSSPTESSPSALLNLGEDILVSEVETPNRLEDVASLADDNLSPLADSLPPLDARPLDSSVPAEAESNEDRMNSPSDGSPKPASEAMAVPAGDAKCDDLLTSLDGSGGFELTTSGLQMPMFTSDGGTDGAIDTATTDGIADTANAGTDGRALPMPAATDAETRAEDAGTATSTAAAAAVVATEASTASNDAEDPGLNRQLGSEIEESEVAETDTTALTADMSSVTSDSSAKYQVSSDPAVESSAKEPLDQSLSHQQEQHHQHEDQEWDSEPAGAVDAEFWEGLRRAAEQTQALMAEAQRQSPQKNYRAMFLADADDAATSATASTTSSALGNNAGASVDSRTSKNEFEKNEATLDDVIFSGHTRQGSGGFDLLVPPAGDSAGAAFDPLELELELEQDLDPELGEEQEEAALAAIRAELRRALPDLDSSSSTLEEQEELAIAETALICPPAVPGLETISEEAEEEDGEEDGEEQEEDRPPDQIPDSWREDFDDFVEVSNDYER